MEHYDLLDHEELVALARLDFESERLTEALTKLKHVTKLRDYPAAAHALLGKIFARLGLYSKACQEFSKFLNRHPDALHERFELGLASRDSGNPGEALRQWEQVLEHAPGYPPALFFRSLVLLDEKRHKDGVLGLQQLISSNDSENLYVKRAKEVLDEMQSREETSTDSARGETAH